MRALQVTEPQRGVLSVFFVCMLTFSSGVCVSADELHKSSLASELTQASMQ